MLHVETGLHQTQLEAQPEARAIVQPEARPEAHLLTQRRRMQVWDRFTSMFFTPPHTHQHFSDSINFVHFY